MAYSDLELLARTIQCEAGGEGNDGMRAVASVIMNRVQAPNGEYARVGKGSIRNIIFQKGQFDCARDIVGGKPNPRTIYDMRPEQIHYDIAQWAISGGRLSNLGTALWFLNPFVPVCEKFFPSNVGQFNIRIRDHCFYNPTEAYAET